MSPMRYKTIEDLNKTLKDFLPGDAQRIYVDAYKESWEGYKDKRGGEMARHGVAHRDGMQAVMHEYKLDQSEGEWHRRGVEEKEEEVDQNLLEEVLDFIETEIMPGGESED